MTNALTIGRPPIELLVSALRSAMELAKPLPFPDVGTRRQVRLNAAVSQEAAARACGTSLRTFIGWENGEHNPVSASAQQYSRLLVVMADAGMADAIRFAVALNDAVEYRIVHPSELANLKSHQFPPFTLGELRQRWDAEGVRNPHCDHEWRIREIMESARDEGILKPLMIGEWVVGEGDYLLEGHHRWSAAMRLDIEVPTVTLRNPAKLG